MSEALARLYDKPFYNNSGEEIPAFAVMQIDEWQGDFKARDFFRVRKPNGSGKQYIINGAFAVPAAGTGFGTQSNGVQALYNTGDGTPAADEAWGPESGSWLMQKGASGFYAVGDADGTTARFSFAGGGVADIIYARVNNTGGTSADTNLYAYDSGVSITGCVTADATGQFRNNGQVLADNQRVALWKRQDTGEYEPEQVGGSAGISLFRLTADMALSASYGTGKPVDDTGTVVSGATAVRLLNWGNRWHGFGPYTDGDTAAASYEGSLVAAVFVTDDHESSGVAGWAIVDCEGWADTLVVKLYAAVSAGSGQCLIQDPSVFGLEASGRLPRIAGDNYDLIAYDSHGVAAEALADQWWVVRYDAANDEYVFLHEYEWSIIRGQCTTTVAAGDTTFSIDNVELVQGFDLGLGSTVTIQKEYLWDPDTAIGATFDNDELVTVAWDKHDGKWRLLDVPDNYRIIKGLATAAVTYASGTFSIDNIEVVRGIKPTTTSVTVINDPVLELNDNDVVYARWDWSQNSGSGGWTTADFANLQGGSVLGTTTGAVTAATSSFSISVTVRLDGNIPTTSSITVQNYFGFDIDSGGKVFAKYDKKNATWYAVQAECPA